MLRFGKGEFGAVDAMLGELNWREAQIVWSLAAQFSSPSPFRAVLSTSRIGVKPSKRKEQWVGPTR